MKNFILIKKSMFISPSNQICTRKIPSQTKNAVKVRRNLFKNGVFE